MNPQKELRTMGPLGKPEQNRLFRWSDYAPSRCLAVHFCII